LACFESNLERSEPTNGGWGEEEGFSGGWLGFRIESFKQTEKVLEGST
jgi:hypothetical protein